MCIWETTEMSMQSIIYAQKQSIEHIFRHIPIAPVHSAPDNNLQNQEVLEKIDFN